MKMQLDVEELSPVKKRISITVPAPRVDSSFSSAYNTISQRARLPGFRRGRVPMSHLRKRFGKQATEEVKGALLEAGWEQALNDYEFVPVGAPDVDAVDPKQGKEYSFSVTVEVTPAVELADPATFKVEMDEWSISDEVVDHELEHLAEEVAGLVPVTDRDEAQMGDQVTVDFIGRVDGEAFDGGAGNDVDLELGTGQFIPGFEEQIVGQKKGEDFEVTVTFPEDYQAEELAGKEAVFSCTLNEIKAKEVIAVGQDLADRVGEESVEDLQKGMRERLEQQWKDRAKEGAKTLLKEALGAHYDFMVPEGMLDNRMEQVRRELFQERMKAAQAEDEGSTPPLDELEEAVEAKRGEEETKLRVDFVLDAIAEGQQIEVEAHEVNAYVSQMARMMGPYGATLRQAYRRPEARAGLRRQMRQDKALDFLLTKVDVTSIPREVPMHDHGADEDTEGAEGATE